MAKGGLGEGTQGRPKLRQNVVKLDELVPKRADDGQCVVTRAIAELANHTQSLSLISGGGGNRKHQISPRIRQLRGITGNRIPSQGKQETAKSTLRKPLCQVAKSNARPRREGRTWEMCPPPRPWARWRARFYRAHGTQTRAVWRVPCCGYWHFRNGNPSRCQKPETTDSHGVRGLKPGAAHAQFKHPGELTTTPLLVTPSGRFVETRDLRKRSSRLCHVCTLEVQVRQC